MAEVLRVPQTGYDETEATVVEWLKKEGDVVEPDDMVVAIETSKATEELPSPVAGVVRKILVEEGTEVVVGIPKQGATFSLPIGTLVGERTITGSMMGSTNLSVDVPDLVALYQQGRYKLDELITGRYPLEKINEAIEATERGEALRNVIVFQE